MSAVATLALVERERIHLDDPVIKILPEFRPRLADGSEPVITLRHLLSHTAGLTYAMLEPAGGPYHQARVSDGLDQPGLSADENLRRIASVPLSFAPGTQWRYSVAYDVLGLLLERATGKPLPELCKELVTAPLAMADTRGPGGNGGPLTSKGAPSVRFSRPRAESLRRWPFFP